MRISVCIICFNEEKNIARCLNSVMWADEIIVVDSLSTDATADIVRNYTEKIFERPWPGYVEQRNFALTQSTGDWVFFIDADEEVSSDLKDEILNKVKEDKSDAFKIPRKSFYQGKWIKHSGYYPDYVLRLFRMGKAKWIGERVHERIDIDGKIDYLENDLFHYPYGGSISGQILTVDEFSSLQAEDLWDKGVRYSILRLIFRPFYKFIEIYFLQKGFLDGTAGFIIAVISALNVFVRYVKLREKESNIENSRSA